MKTTDKDVLNFIRSYGVEHGYLPTIREIGDALGIHSTSAIWLRMNNLEHQGYIHKNGVRYSVEGLRYVIDD